MPPEHLHIIKANDADTEGLWTRRLESFARTRESDRVLVKENAMRRVWRLTDAAGDFFVKEHFRHGWRQRMQDVLRGDPAFIEFRASQYGLRSGLPVVHIGACARWINADSKHVVLTVSAAIENAISLADAFDRIDADAKCTQRKRRLDALLEAVAVLFAKAHDAAFVLVDAHPGNILIQTGPTDRPTCFMVDIYDSRLGRVVDECDAARNLAALNQWFSRRTSRSRRLHFVKHYLAQSRRRGSPEDLKAFAAQVIAESLRHDRKLERKRDRRIGRGNAFFKACRLAGGRRAWIAVRSRYLARALPINEAAFADLGRIESSTPENKPTGVTPVASGDTHTETWFAQSLRDRLTWKFLGSPGRRLFRSSWRALHRGIPAAGGVRCIEGRTLLGLAWSSWTPLGPNDGQPLPVLLHDVSTADRREALHAVGRLLADTALAGLAIRNPSTHRLWATRSRDGRLAVYWSGIDGLPVSRPAPPHIWKWVLNQFVADPTVRRQLSRTDRARVIRGFSWRMGAASGGYRSLLREIEEAGAPH